MVGMTDMICVMIVVQIFYLEKNFVKHIVSAPTEEDALNLLMTAGI